MIVTDILVLRRKIMPVVPGEIHDIILKLESELSQSKISGVGLSAPQIGINKSVAIIRYSEDEVIENIDLINPKILEKSNPYINKNESCLSFPGISVDTQRYREIVVVDDLHPSGLVITGFVSTIVQHEIDHLENILIIDRTIGKNKIRPNELCPCNSGLKAKKCHFK